MNQDPTREDIETVVSNMVEGRIVNEESEITFQTIVLIGIVVLALGLVVLSLRFLVAHIVLRLSVSIAPRPNPWVWFVPKNFIYCLHMILSKPLCNFNAP